MLYQNYRTFKMPKGIKSPETKIRKCERFTRMTFTESDNLLAFKA